MGRASICLADRQWLGMTGALDRSRAYVEAGADMLFPEAFQTLDQYAQFTQAFPHVPVLANQTEFGVTPLFGAGELGQAGVSLVLYPLSAFRAMSKAAEQVYEAIVKGGSQRECLPLMQTRAELYHRLDYLRHEQAFDRLLKNKEKAMRDKE